MALNIIYIFRYYVVITHSVVRISFCYYIKIHYRKIIFCDKNKIFFIDLKLKKKNLRNVVRWEQ